MGFAQCGVSLSYSNSVWCACTGSVFAIPTGTPPFHFMWSTGATVNHIDSLCAGTYTVTLTDSNGCIKVDSVTITQPSAMTFTITSTAVSCTSCNDACITTNATGGCPPYNFVYSPFDPQPCQGMYDTTYTVTITDNCNCTLTGSITPDTIPVGIRDNLFSERSILIYPNPVTENLIIQSADHQKKYLSISNALGEEIIKSELLNPKSEIDVSKLARGIYIAEVRGEKSSVRKKFVKE